MNRALSLELLPLKKAVRDAISQLGGIDGVVSIVERQRSTVGRWNNINDADLPPLDAAFAIDQALVVTGRKPVIAAKLARALGATLAMDNAAPSKIADLLTAHANIVRAGGDVQVAIAEALADGEIDTREKNRIRNAIADDKDALTALDQLVQTS